MRRIRPSPSSEPPNMTTVAPPSGTFGGGTVVVEENVNVESPCVWAEKFQCPKVSSFSTPCTWTVETDRGSTHFVLRGDEDIRRIGADGTLLISDSHGIQYLVRDQYALDAKSKKILDRFL